MTFVALHLAVAVVMLSSVDAGTGTQNTPASSAAPQLLDPITRGVRAGRKGGGAGSASATGDLPLLRAATDGSGDLLHDAPGFSARIAPNGNVSFSDKRLTVLSWLPWAPVAGPSNIPSLQATVSGFFRNRKPPRRSDEDPPNTHAYLAKPLLTPFRPDPQEACRACNVPLDLLPVNIALGFDLTDEVMRMSGQDPYRYGKARFLISTRDLRTRKAARAHAEDIHAAAAALPVRIRAIACDARRSLRERRQIIEALRDELDGATPEARAAVDQITQFLSAHFGVSDGDQKEKDKAENKACPVARPEQ